MIYRLHGVLTSQFLCSWTAEDHIDMRNTFEYIDSDKEFISELKTICLLFFFYPQVENILLHRSGNYMLCDFGSATGRVLDPRVHSVNDIKDEIEKYEHTIFIVLGGMFPTKGVYHNV